MTKPEDMGEWVPSEREDVIGALRVYCPNHTFCDLGAGDNCVVEWARECGAVNPRGIEYYDLIAVDILGDFFDFDFLQYDVLYYFFIGNRQDVELFKLLKENFHGIFILNKRYAEETLTDLMLGEPVGTFGTAKVFHFP